MSASVSPPPLKRRRLSLDKDTTVFPNPDVLSIYSHNVNGIGPYLQPAITKFFKPTQKDGNAFEPATLSLRDCLRRYGWPTILFLQEVKIAPRDSATVKALERAVSAEAGSTEPDYCVHVCLPSDKHNVRGSGGKVYGVASIIRKDFFNQRVSRIGTVDWDREGRFLVCETKPDTTGRRLAIFNVYAVNGTDLPYKDPDTGEVRGTRHDRKLAVHKLLAGECRSLEASGYDVVIAGDLNVARATIDGHPRLRTYPPQHCINRADFEARFFSSSDADDDATSPHIKDSGGPHQLGMIDTFRHVHSQTKGYTYYPRGKAFGESCDRVDLIMVSHSLGDSIVDAGILATAADRGPSDHVPLYVKLRLDDSAEKSVQPGARDAGNATEAPKIRPG